MSSDEPRSREALKPEDFLNLPRTRYRDWLLENLEWILEASGETKSVAKSKFEKFYPADTFPVDAYNDAKEAGVEHEEAISAVTGIKRKIETPSIIKSLNEGPPTLPPQSKDIEYLSYAEVVLQDEFNTLDEMLIEDIDNTSPNGPFIERCVGRNPENQKLRVVKFPAKAVKIRPDQVMQYLGPVTEDRQAVHSPSVVVHGRRVGYTFDRFFYHNGEKLARCCLVLDRVHQAGLMCEKVISKRRKAFPKIKTLAHSNRDAMYRVVGQKETYYRDLKRLYERHFIKRGDEELAEDIGLKNLAGMG